MRLLSNDSLLSFLLLATSIHSLHLMNPDTTSIPNLIPRFFQKFCDQSDAYFSEEVRISTSPDAISTISFVAPPQNVSSAFMKRTANFWTHEPFCLESVEAKNGFCVYTNAKFARGRGISFVATPNDIQYVLQAKIFRKGLQNEATTSSPGALKYYRKAVPGEKRFEVIANGTYQRGEMIHSYTPILVIEDPWVAQMTKEDQTLLLRIAIERLPRKSQELFLSQFTQEGRDPYIDRMDKNAFNVQMGKSRQFFSGALPETARFNHDCRPSTVYHINPETLQHQSFVVRPIKAGEEITLSYLPPYLNSTSRRNLLSQSWGFDCTCKLCTASAATKRHSDLRLLKIESIIAELNILPSKRIIDPKKAEELVRLHEQEGLWGNIGGAHMYVAMEYEVLGNRKMAKKWAGVAKESLGLLSGEGHEYHFAMKRILGEDVGSERPYARHL